MSASWIPKSLSHTRLYKMAEAGELSKFHLRKNPNFVVKGRSILMAMSVYFTITTYLLTQSSNKWTAGKNRSVLHQEEFSIFADAVVARKQSLEVIAKANLKRNLLKNSNHTAGHH